MFAAIGRELIHVDGNMISGQAVGCSRVGLHGEGRYLDGRGLPRAIRLEG